MNLYLSSWPQSCLLDRCSKSCQTRRNPTHGVDVWFHWQTNLLPTLQAWSSGPRQQGRGDVHGHRACKEHWQPQQGILCRRSQLHSRLPTTALWILVIDRFMNFVYVNYFGVIKSIGILQFLPSKDKSSSLADWWYLLRMDILLWKSRSVGILVSPNLVPAITTEGITLIDIKYLYVDIPIDRQVK